MNAPYEHPPRGLSYYLSYLLILFICLLPGLIGIPIYTAGKNLSPIELGSLILVIAVLQLLIIARPMLLRLTVLTDTGLPRDNDISYQMLPYPEVLSEAAMLLEMEGFERLGELETPTVLAKMPIPQWVYRSPKGHITVGLVEVGEGASASAFLGFTTYGAKGNVTTTFPHGHQLRTKHSRYSGVNSSIEAAYAHHRQQVQEWMAEGNKPIAVTSIEQYAALDVKNGPENKVWMRQPLIDEVAGFFFLYTAITPGFLLFAGTLFPGIYGDILVEDRLMGGFIALVIGLGTGLLIGRRSKGIKGKAVKRKTKAKRK